MVSVVPKRAVRKAILKPCLVFQNLYEYSRRCTDVIGCDDSPMRMCFAGPASSELLPAVFRLSENWKCSPIVFERVKMHVATYIAGFALTAYSLQRYRRRMTVDWSRSRWTCQVAGASVVPTSLASGLEPVFGLSATNITLCI